MNYRRELEHKYVLTGISKIDADATIQSIFTGSLEVSGRSSDTFWRHHMVDFIRLRENTKELTIKVTDKGTVEDRIEENVRVDDLDTTIRLLTAMHGEPVGKLTKTYDVYYTPLAIVSLYTVHEDPENRLFLEVESEDMEDVKDCVGIFREYFRMEKQDKSLYQLFLEGK